MKREFSPDSFSKNAEIPNFMNFLPVGAELFHTDRRTRKDGHDETNSRFRNFEIELKTRLVFITETRSTSLIIKCNSDCFSL